MPLWFQANVSNLQQIKEIGGMKKKKEKGKRNLNPLTFPTKPHSHQNMSDQN
jgi:hypothetical protein